MLLKYRSVTAHQATSTWFQPMYKRRRCSDREKGCFEEKGEFRPFQLLHASCFVLLTPEEAASCLR
jgi:hypothetical protein